MHTAGNAGANETTAFIGLEQFENQGLISLQDGREGDVFQISNTPGGRDLAFVASGNSALAVDAFLGGAGSKADNFIIDGNVSGKTTLSVNNTNPGVGQFNPGIPVVYVNGNTASDAFFLPKPIESGLFNYDLFFVPTGSGIFELKSFPGASAHVLPQLVTANQDIWWTTSDTWLDRTADLRVLLNHGASVAYDPKDIYAGVSPSFTPATWVRAGGQTLNRDDTQSTTAFGRTFDFNLDRNLTLANFQAGVDFGKRELFSHHDALVFGFLGGAVLADLDYNKQTQQFRIDGGEVGAYATYLSGGLFVDTLFDAQFLNIDTQEETSGFPGSMDDTNSAYAPMPATVSVASMVVSSFSHSPQSA